MDVEVDTIALLRQAAEGQALDHSLWPQMLPEIIRELQRIANDEFPRTIIPEHFKPANTATSEPPEDTTIPLDETRISGAEPPLEPPSTITETTKPSESEPTANTDDAHNNPQSIEESDTSTADITIVADSEPNSSLPPQIQDMLNEIIRTLETFPTAPPHTLQRIAELVTQPKRHYRNVAPFLHALDRVVHVTSSLDVYPLNFAVPDMSRMGPPNGVTPDTANGRVDSFASSSAIAVGSDEALGGALLTPIPWLARRVAEEQAAHESSNEALSDDEQVGNPDEPHHHHQELRSEGTETIDGPNGVGSIETVSVSINGVPSSGSFTTRGVTQGELLRQEQRAGIIPVSVSDGEILTSNSLLTRRGPHHQLNGEAATDDLDDIDDDTEGIDTPEDSDEEVPHVRGPEEIGASDLGPQRGSGNFGVGAAGGAVEMASLDLDAAVGRKGEPVVDASNKDENNEKTKEQSSVDADAMDVDTDAPTETGLVESTEKDLDKPAAATTTTAGTAAEKSDDENKKSESEDAATPTTTDEENNATATPKREAPEGGADARRSPSHSPSIKKLKLSSVEPEGEGSEPRAA